MECKKKPMELFHLLQSKLVASQEKEKLVYDTVEDIASRHNIQTPEVGVYGSMDPNAFATGPSKNKSLVAVSTGLLHHMNEREIEGVVAHEMAHVLNGDMVTMTLLQWVLNTFVIFFARIIADAVNNATDGKLGGLGYMGVYIGLQMLLGIFASIVLMAFSRHREFRADEGSSSYVGKEKMIAALESLQKMKNIAPKSEWKFAAMQISTQTTGGLKSLFMSHPPLEARIKNWKILEYRLSRFIFAFVLIYTTLLLIYTYEKIICSTAYFIYNCFDSICIYRSQYRIC